MHGWRFNKMLLKDDDYNKKKPSLAKQIAFGGISILLTIVSLYLASTLPTNRIFFLGLSSVFLAIVVIEFGTRAAILNYISTSILGFLILPNKVILLPFISFLGYYGIIKFYIEKLDNFIFEWILKLLAFNGGLYLVYTFTNTILLGDISIDVSIWVIIVIAEIIFIVYDYAYSVAIWYYRRKLRNIFRY